MFRSYKGSLHLWDKVEAHKAYVLFLDRGSHACPFVRGLLGQVREMGYVNDYTKLSGSAWLNMFAV